MQLTKDQRKILVALLGLIAAVAAAIAGGWAVHLALSYQDSSITATDGGVVNQDIQGSPITHTGTGDINSGIQHKVTGDFDPGIQLKGQRDIHISITLEQYEAGLKRREQEVTERLKQALAQDRRILEQEKSEIERQLADTKSSYQAHIEGLEKRIAQLETIRGQIPNKLLV